MTAPIASLDSSDRNGRLAGVQDIVGRASTDASDQSTSLKARQGLCRTNTAGHGPLTCLSSSRPFFRPSDVEATYQDPFRRPWILCVSDDPPGATSTFPDRDLSTTEVWYFEGFPGTGDGFHRVRPTATHGYADYRNDREVGAEFNRRITGAHREKSCLPYSVPHQGSRQNGAGLAGSARGDSPPP